MKRQKIRYPPSRTLNISHAKCSILFMPKKVLLPYGLLKCLTGTSLTLSLFFFALQTSSAL